MPMQPLICYRLPYGKNLHTDWETLEFMSGLGLDAVVVSPMNVENYAGQPYSDYPPIWCWDNGYDFDSLDRQFSDVLAHSHDARIITVVDLNTPRWLSRRLELDSFEDLSDLVQEPNWHQTTMNYLRAFVSYCEQKYPDLVIGYIPACGATLEWIDHRSLTPGRLKSLNYAAYCREHGWPERPIPTFDRTARSTHGHVRDPQAEADVIQFQRYVNAVEADFAIEVNRELRRLIRPDKLVGSFFGYLHGMDSNGHLDALRVFDTAPPDFVIGASCNCDHTSGSAGSTTALRHTLERRGIRFMHEIDRLTDTSPDRISPFIRCVGPFWRRWETPEAAAAGLRRESAMALICNNAMWYFNIWGHSYHSPAVRAALADSARIWHEHAGRSGGSAAEILLVFDIESNFHVNTVDVPDWPRFQNLLGHELRFALSQSRYAADSAEWSDLEHIDLSQYRMIIFQNPTVLTAGRRQFLEEKVLTGGRLIVWGLPPGVIRDNRHTGQPAEFAPGDYTAITPADPAELTPERLRELAAAAGVHEYAPGCAAWASGEYLMITRSAPESGLVEITLRSPATAVTELFSNREIPVDGAKFTDMFAADDTRLYFIKCGEN